MSAATQAAMPSTSAAAGESYTENKKQNDVRTSNILAAKAVSDAVRTSLGPKGMDKMIKSPNGDVIITNDGATILKHMEVMHPAAKMLVELSKAQDVEAGDGTTTVVVICGALLQASLTLLQKGVHPSIISESFGIAQAYCETVLEKMSRPVSLTDRTQLIQSATTSLSSKVVSANASLLAPIAVDSVLRILDPANEAGVDLKNIRVTAKLGGTVDDTELVEGLVFTQKAVHSANGPTVVKGAKIALIQFCLSPPKTDIENSVVVSEYQQMDRVLKEERAYQLQLVKAIAKTGCNVLLIQKSILRDALTELSAHFLAKAKIMVVKDIEREEIDYVCKTLGCTPVATADALKPEKLGSADLVKEHSTSDGKIVKITGVPKPCRTVSVLVRGSNKLVLDEAERSLHDALCVIRSLVKNRNLIVGGGAPEYELSLRLDQHSRELHGMQRMCVRAFGEALKVVPWTLAENAGLHPLKIENELHARHVAGDPHAGINVKKGTVSNMWDENVIQPLLVTSSAVHLATEVVKMLMKIDDIVFVS